MLELKVPLCLEFSFWEEIEFIYFYMFICRALLIPWHVCKGRVVCYRESIIFWAKLFLLWLLLLGNDQREQIIMLFCQILC